MKNLFSKIAKVQEKLFVPKNQKNSFGGFNYRSCEDILVKLKSLLQENNMTLILHDEVVAVADRCFVKAIATVADLETGLQYSGTGFAELAKEKRGADLAQITGAASSYARKYALNGLFAIDNTKDADTDEYRIKRDEEQSQVKEQAQEQPEHKSQATQSQLTAEQLQIAEAIKEQIKKVATRLELNSLMSQHKNQPYYSMLRDEANARAKQVK